MEPYTHAYIMEPYTRAYIMEPYTCVDSCHWSLGPQNAITGESTIYNDFFW